VATGAGAGGLCGLDAGGRWFICGVFRAYDLAWEFYEPKPFKIVERNGEYYVYDYNEETGQYEFWYAYVEVRYAIASGYNVTGDWAITMADVKQAFEYMTKNDLLCKKAAEVFMNSSFLPNPYKMGIELRIDFSVHSMSAAGKLKRSWWGLGSEIAGVIILLSPYQRSVTDLRMGIAHEMIEALYLKAKGITISDLKPFMAGDNPGHYFAVWYLQARYGYR